MWSLSNRGRVVRNTTCAVATPKIDGCRVASTHEQAPLDGSRSRCKPGSIPGWCPWPPHRSRRPHDLAASRARVELQRERSLCPTLDGGSFPEALAADLGIGIGEVVAAYVPPDAGPADAKHLRNLRHTYEVEWAHVDEATAQG
jgi:hypothetical protein